MYPVDVQVPAAEEMLRRAIALAVDNVAAGGGPFGAVLVTADGRVFEGVNRVTRDNDPTAHAEVVAIRRACRETGSFELGGSVLYASCEPCPMCLATALWARIPEVRFAADRHAAAAAGFSDAAFYDFLEGREREAMRVTRDPQTSENDPFEAWLHHEQRIRY